MNYIRDRIRGIFRLNDSPSRLAYAFAVGVFIAFSPTIGLHTVTCFLFAWMFRLNKVVVFTGAFVNNPWTMVPMYGFCLWFGIKITGDGGAVPSIAWNELSLRNAYEVLAPYLWPFLAGTVVIGLIAAAAAYFVMYYGIVRYRRSEVGKQGLPAVDGSL